MQYTNKYNINLLVAAWLINDDYDYNPDPSVVSTTTLLKPIKKLVLGQEATKNGKTVDVSDLIARAMGSAMHDALEAFWRNEDKRNRALEKLGIPQRLIDSILINPSEEEIRLKVEAGEKFIPLYFEQRHRKKLGDYTITGKYDNVCEGIVHDLKTTSVFVASLPRVIEDYKRQMSIYRWIAPHIITENFGRINFVFKDWQSGRAKSDPNYPQHQFQTINIPLMTFEETEAFVAERLKLYISSQGLPEEKLPPCTPEDLWMSEPEYAYYSDPSKVGIGKASKVFSGPNAKRDAYQHQAEKVKGCVVERLGEAKACSYCDGFDLCKQKDQYARL